MNTFWQSAEYINLLQPFIYDFTTALNLSSVNRQAQYSYKYTYDYCKRQPLINSNINFKNHFRCMICNHVSKDNIKPLHFDSDYPSNRRTIFHCIKPSCSIRSIVSWGKELIEDRRFTLKRRPLITLNTVDISFDEIKFNDLNNNIKMGYIINGLINKLTLFLEKESNTIYVRIAFNEDNITYLSHNWMVKLKEVMIYNDKQYILDQLKEKPHRFYSEIWNGALKNIWDKALDAL